MNNIELKLKVAKTPIIRDSIQFKDIAYVELYIDGKNLTETDFKDSFVYFSELKNSLLHSGSFLIFTCVSGIADDGGWNKIKVINQDNNISWHFNYDEILYSYLFDKVNYLTEVKKIETEVNNLTGQFKLEPTHVIFPEEDI